MIKAHGQQISTLVTTSTVTRLDSKGMMMRYVKSFNLSHRSPFLSHL